MSRRGAVAVIGGGISGLTAAHDLAQRGADVTVFEAGPRAGGILSTVRTDDGFVFERGPNSLRPNQPTLDRLVAACGLSDARIESAPAAKKRYVWSRGKLRALPTKPPGILTTKALSPRARLRLLAEPFVRPRRDGADETLLEFFERRIGAEPVAALLDPFVSGIYAGRPDRLGLDAMPTIRDAEATNGSLFKTLRSRARGPSTALWSLTDGLGQLTDAVAATLGERVKTDATVKTLAKRPGGWLVETERSSDVFEAVVLAVPAYVAGELLGSVVGRELSATLSAIPYPHVASVSLGFAARDVVHPLDGFGCLTASDSPLPRGGGPALGIIFASSVFVDRAPDDHVALTVMIGGDRDRASAERDDPTLIRDAVSACDALLGLRGEPVTHLVTRWPRAIPQYRPGHKRRLQQVIAALPPELALAGNWLNGVSVEAAAASGAAAAERVLR